MSVLQYIKSKIAKVAIITNNNMNTTHTEESGITNLKEDKSLTIPSSVKNNILRSTPTANGEEPSESSYKKVKSRLKSDSVKCLWLISSKGCIFQVLEPRDACH